MKDARHEPIRGRGLIEERRDEIVRRFVAADRLDGAATSLSDEVVANSLRDFLGELVTALRIAHTPSGRSASATEHGAQRFNLGYDVGSIVREYALVRDVLFDLADESGGAVTPLEMRLLEKFLIHGIADSASTYATVRDEQLREQTRKHVAFLAHELRNPLGSARLALHLLRERGDLVPSPVAGCTRSVQRSTRPSRSATSCASSSTTRRRRPKPRTRCVRRRARGPSSSRSRTPAGGCPHAPQRG